jgi:hypothetical protein
MPSSGKYTYQDTIMGAKVDMYIEISLTEPDKGTFNFVMNKPVKISCASGNTLIYDEKKKKLNINLGQCAQDSLNKYYIRIETLDYDVNTKTIKGNVNIFGVLTKEITLTK